MYSLPIGQGRRFLGNANGFTEAVLGGWDVGGIINARSGVPVNVLVTRPDILYRGLPVSTTQARRSVERR